MIDDFKLFLRDQIACKSSDPILLAISGGIDSVVLAHLLYKSDFNFGLAHCNFQLRGEAADQDESFVQQLAQSMEVPFFSIAFDTDIIAAQRKQSIQVVARDLRYEWLEKIRLTEGYSFIATAHHINDSIETILYNFAKGSGIRGLSGIPIKNGKVIRPLLFTNKKDILAFAKTEKISFREDASNASDKYTRNRIRHHIVPELEKINPSLDTTIQQSVQHLKDTASLLDWAIEKIKKDLMQSHQDQHRIDLKKLSQYPANNTILYELLHPFGFNGDQVLQLQKEQSTNSGRQFYSADYRLLIDRDQLMIQPIAAASNVKPFTIEKGQTEIWMGNQQLSIEEKEDKPGHFSNDKKQAYLDLDQLVFPLQVRRWKAGDIFQPLGMKGCHQKVQDFLTNQKLSILEKEQLWILESDQKICWIIGHRLDERFKIKDSTKSVMKISLKP